LYIRLRNQHFGSIVDSGYDDVIKFGQNLLEIGIRNTKANLSKKRKKDQKHNNKSAIRWKLPAIARLSRKTTRHGLRRTIQAGKRQFILPGDKATKP